MTRALKRPFRQTATAQQWRRLTDIESLLSWATRLLRGARHDTMKDALRIVIRDLEDGLQSLLHVDPALWTEVDLTTTHARSRLRMIADTFETKGSDAEFTRASEPFQPRESEISRKPRVRARR